MTYTILDVILSIAVILVTAFLIPALKAKKSNEEWKHILNSAQIAVNAAEQIFDYKDNEEKYNYVNNILKKIFKNKLTEQEREMLIENSVKELNNIKNDLIK